MGDGLDDILKVFASFENVQEKDPIHNGIFNGEQRKSQKSKIVGILK
jgi:hypothetical protein